jgi:hypothetical protein
MLRITIHEDSTSLTFQLEGRLAGPWVRELEDCWQSTVARKKESAGRFDRSLRFDLEGVTYVDTAGKEFLTARHANGAKFLVSGCLMRAVVAEITHGPVPNFGSPEHLTEEQIHE